MRRSTPRSRAAAGVAAALLAGGCASSGAPGPGVMPRAEALASVPNPDPRIDLEPGVFDAEQAAWNLRLVSSTPPSQPFVGGVNSDLAFAGPYAIQGSFSGFQIWDISDAEQPELVNAYHCPAAQSDVSTYRNLLFAKSP